jgi:hypothetical protein
MSQITPEKVLRALRAQHAAVRDADYADDAEDADKKLKPSA